MAEGRPVGDAAWIEAQRFLNAETALLDARDYDAWLSLLAPDVRYRVYARIARRSENAPEDVALVDEDLHGLTLRVRQLADPRLTHAENPPSLTRRFLSNFRVFEAAPPAAFAVETSLLVWRCRGTVPDGALYAGARRDVLRRLEDGGLAIVERDVRLDQTVLAEGSLSLVL